MSRDTGMCWEWLAVMGLAAMVGCQGGPALREPPKVDAYQALSQGPQGHSPLAGQHNAKPRC